MLEKARKGRKEGGNEQCLATSKKNKKEKKKRGGIRSIIKNFFASQPRTCLVTRKRVQHVYVDG